MKKLITVLFAMMMTTSAFANGMIGIKYGTGDLEGTKKSYTAGSTTYAAQTKDESHEYGAIFFVLNVPDVDGLSVGIDFIPYTATVSVDGNSSDSHLELSDHTTLYGLYSMDLGGFSPFLKVGYSMADIAAFANYSTTTINSHDDTLEGLTLAAGFQAEVTDGVVGRFEASYTEYDDVTATTTSNGSTSVKKTASSNLTTFSVAIAKTF